MGLNIAGVAINKSYKNQIDELSQDLGLKLFPMEEITIDEATRNWKDEGIADICFTERGTLVLLPHEECAEALGTTAELDVLTFGFSETSMVFLLYLTEKGVNRREIMENEGTRHVDVGAPLENMDESDMSNLTLALVEKLIGVSFWELYGNATAIRCSLRPLAAEPAPKTAVETPIASVAKPTPKHQATKVVLEPKKWWQFWK